MPNRERHIAVIDPGCRLPELDAFNRLSHLSSSCLSYHLPAMFGMESLLDMPSKPSGLIILGSGASVYDDLPWQNSLNQWLQGMLCADVPTLGLCYGHQLLAHMHGGKVGLVNADKSKLVGSRRVTMTCNGFWGEQGQQFQWIVSHRECVTSLPTDFEIIATSNEVACDGFRHRHRPIWGIQAHPEAGPGFVRNQELPVPYEPADPFADGRLFMLKFFELVAR